MKEWTSKKSNIIILHIAVWILFFTLSIVSRPSFNMGSFTFSTFLEREKNSFYRNAFDVIFFYCNAYLLLPKLAFKKKYILLGVSWCLFFLLSSTGAYLIQKYNPQGSPRFMLTNAQQTLLKLSQEAGPYKNLHWERLEPNPGFSFFFGFFPFLTMLGLSTTFRLVSDKIKADRIIKEKENEGLKTELAFLRSQTSPHFLFNTMNSMVAMARLKSDMLEPSLIKLSGLLRYMLYSTDDAKVTMKDEIEFLESFIDLQRLRFDDDVQVNLNIRDDNSVQSIEPMLLIPFIENAFKHGSSMISGPVVQANLEIHEHMLLFHIKNKYNAINAGTKDSASGIGLANVSRRLNLLYSGSHNLEIKEDQEWFCVSLKLKF